MQLKQGDLGRTVHLQKARIFRGYQAGVWERGGGKGAERDLGSGWNRGLYTNNPKPHKGSINESIKC